MKGFNDFKSSYPPFQSFPDARSVRPGRGGGRVSPSLPMIARLLGHAEVQTTARYARLTREAMNASAARIAASIGEDILRGAACLSPS